MAEAFLKKYGNGEFLVESAGLEPGKLNPYVVRAMSEIGIDISHNAVKSVADFQRQGKKFQIVVKLCSKEASERCPIFPGEAERLHWPFEDPSTFEGSDEEIMQKVRAVRDQISIAVKEFASAHSKH
jgi:arsenate reductase